MASSRWSHWCTVDASRYRVHITGALWRGRSWCFGGAPGFLAWRLVAAARSAPTRTAPDHAHVGIARNRVDSAPAAVALQGPSGFSFPSLSGLRAEGEGL